LKRWLGAFEDAETIIKVAVSELPFSCHTRSNDQTNMMDIGEPQCVGRLLFSSRVGKIFRTPTLELLRIKAKADNPDSDILNYQEFLDHHKELKK